VRACRAWRLLGGLTAVLLLCDGCGGSSTHSSTTSSTGASAQQPSTARTASTQATRPSTQAQGGVVTGSAGGVTATLHAADHSPRVGRLWPIRFTATRNGRPARASVAYEYLFGGQVVAHRSHYAFTGHFSDTFQWPASAVGYPLTLRAVIVSGGATINLDYPVQVTQ